MWCNVLDKGYIGADRYLRAIIHARSRPSQNTDEMEVNELILVENFFGRLKITFKICRTNFRGSNEFYNKVIPVCSALTNMLIRERPLRVEDKRYNDLIRQRMYMRRSMNNIEENGNKTPQSNVTNENNSGTNLVADNLYGC